MPLMWSHAVQDLEHIELFHKRHQQPPQGASVPPQELRALLERGEGVPDFLHDHKLRDFQVTGFAWMARHIVAGTNCILADEMGLGQTVQVRSEWCQLWPVCVLLMN